MDIEERGPEGDLTDLERRLVRWQPASGSLDRDRMLFEAGRATGRAETSARFGLATSAALLLMAVGLGLPLVRERARRQALEVLVVRQGTPPASPLPSPPEPRPEPTPPPSFGRDLAPDSYLALSHRMLDSGLDDDPAPASDSPPGGSSSSPEPPLRVRGASGLLKF